jgi:hypothetical protein
MAYPLLACVAVNVAFLKAAVVGAVAVQISAVPA